MIFHPLILFDFADENRNLNESEKVLKIVSGWEKQLLSSFCQNGKCDFGTFEFWSNIH